MEPPARFDVAEPEACYNDYSCMFLVDDDDSNNTKQNPNTN